MSDNAVKTVSAAKPRRRRKVTHEWYGYLFILPFFLVYLGFQIFPLINTFRWSLLNYTDRYGNITINFNGLKGFADVLGITAGEKAYFFKYLLNTVIMWMGGFIPQIIISLLIAAWLTNTIVKVRGQGAIKILTYMPNIITAASISVLFASLFAQYGPVTVLLKKMGVIAQDFNFLDSIAGTRGLISFILFWMWYGNTTLLLIAGMLGINPSLYEAASIDGASGTQRFFRVTLPLLKPILLFTLVTSAVGGLQMYDIPSLFNVVGSSYVGNPSDSTTTVTMYIMRLYNSKNYGKASVVSVLLFIVTLIVSLILFKVMGNSEKTKKKRARA